MSVVAVTDHARSLAQAVDELLVLARNQAGGSCVWCGSRDLVTREPRRPVGADPADGDCLAITCRDCGTELVSERSPHVRGRSA